MKIKMIIPLMTDQYNDLIMQDVMRYLAPDTQIVIECLENGSPFIESRYDEMCDAPEIVKKIIQAEMEGFDGVFISCFSDPAVRVARDCVSIPVVGGFEPAVYQAALVSKQWGIVTVNEASNNMIKDLSTIVKVEKFIACIRNIHMPMSDLRHSEQLIEDKLFNEIEKAVIEDKVTAIILGCTGLLGMSHRLRQRFKTKEQPVIIDPTAAALGCIQMMIRSGISHNKIEYPFPEQRARTICNDV